MTLAVAQLTVDLGSPTTISEIGVTEESIADLTDDAFADVCTPGNPRPVTRDDIEAIYRSLMRGLASLTRKVRRQKGCGLATQAGHTLSSERVLSLLIRAGLL